MNQEQSFFEYAAAVGLTKHIGSLDATDQLAELCRIGAGQMVLDVGCGVGVTACYLAKKFGCHVVGVDIVEEMIVRSRERAQQEKLTHLVTFRVGDVQELPFDDNLFDVVISESVTAFPDDKLKAVQEYKRVVKPGGRVGLNESTWLKTPLPPEVETWAEQEVGAAVKPLTAVEWRGLLDQAGLTDIIMRIRGINLKDESKGILRRYGLAGMLRSMGRMLRLYVQNPSYRQFVKRVRQQGLTPQNLDVYFGYGLYVGKKPE